MRNYNKLQELIEYLDNINKNSPIRIIDFYSLENIRFVASHEIKTSEEKLYGFQIQKITLFPLKVTNIIAAFHIFINTQPDLFFNLIDEFGNFEIEAGWGIGDNLSDSKIHLWKFKHFQIILKKNLDLL